MAKRARVSKRTEAPTAIVAAGASAYAFSTRPDPLVRALPLEVALRTGVPVQVLDSVPDAVRKAAPQFEPGAQLEDMRELFLAKDAGAGAGILLLRRKEDGSWTAQLGKSRLPWILTPEAKERGTLPPPGESWLPASLAAVVPVRNRYWTMTGAEALAARNDLIDSGMFGEDLVKLVDGELRLCAIQHYLYAPDDVPEAFPPTLGKAIVAMLSRFPEDTEVVSAEPGADLSADLAKRGAVVLFSVQGDGTGLVPLLAPDHAADWVVVASEDARATLAKLGRVFSLPHLPGLVVTSFPPGCDVVWEPTEVAAKPEARPVEKSRPVRFMVAKDGDPKADERYILGVVLEPDIVDAQNDTYDAGTIRTAAHKFMEDFGAVKLMHSGEPINDKVKILESYIAPVDFTVGDQVVKAGTWLMAVKVLDDGLWSAAKSGELTGFSIGGSALRAPAS